ncbi:predicted protein [Nematostella vectensis]|uniref:MYND-type domain-containing protein n=1 Tax=Nematostella vectensis TaxID=45351 RepID=A7SIP0_NEMVE|nr:predicted protein [Nematostella vectensis]|eukprot:XP_001628485.1 predicted protein [Nematostella vectensis]
MALYRNQCWHCCVFTEGGPKCLRCNIAEYCSAQCRDDNQWRHKVDCDNVSRQLYCHKCSQKGGNMKQCSNCLSAWYCSKECQGEAWGSHKKRCTKMAKKTVQVWEQLKCLNIPGVSFTYSLSRLYYWGNSPAIDLLKLRLNEGEEVDGPLSLLLCGAGDGRHVFLTLAELPRTYKGQVTFVLNDIEPCVLARTVLMLYLTVKGGASKASLVTQIWYSLWLSASELEFLVSALQDLTRISCLEVISHGVLCIKNEHLKTLQSIWKVWLLLVGEHIDLENQRKGVVHEPSFYLADVLDKHKESLKAWFKHGVLCQDGSDAIKMHENVTLTGFKILEVSQMVKQDFKYAVPPQSYPFTGWDYKDAHQNFPEIDSVQQLYSRYISLVLQKSAQISQDAEKVRIKFVLGDFRDLPQVSQEGVKFDRIHMSNLWDYGDLSEVLSLAKHFLNPKNPSATVVTETFNWVKFFPRLMADAALNSFTKPKQNKEGGTDPEDDQLMMGATALHIKENEHYFLTGRLSDINFLSPRVLFSEHYNIMEHFLRYLRASLLSAEVMPPRFLPSLKKLAEDKGFVLRDPTRFENRVAPFRWGASCRLLSCTRGSELSLEWTVKQ